MITGVLPEPSIHYEAFTSSVCNNPDRARDTVFFALFGNSNILCSDSAGNTALYDTKAHSFHGLPRLNSPKGPRRITLCIPRTEAHARSDFEIGLKFDPDLFTTRPDGFFPEARRGNHRYSLYVMDMDPYNNLCCFEALVYYPVSRWCWRQLPMPAIFGNPRYRARDNVSFAVVDGTKICVSFPSESATYCFDTVAMEWSKVGDDWALPFRGRAEYIPELGQWVGLSARKPYNLCSMNLSGVTTLGSCDTQPVAMDVIGQDFDDLPLPEHDCSLKNAALVNMGSGRFCVARFFDRSHGDQENQHQVVVLTGVELHRPDDGRGEEGALGVTTHKSERLSSDSILCVL
jgi:hypothetical protein